MRALEIIIAVLLALALAAQAVFATPTGFSVSGTVTGAISVTPGAKCDGITDDHVALQAAINAGAAAGSLITAPAGLNCVTSVALNLPANVQLVGNWTISRPTGNSGPVLQTNNGSQTCGTLVTNVRVTGLTLDGKATARVAADVIDLFCASKSYVEWNNIQNAEVGGINVINSINSQVDHNYIFKAFGDCIYDQGSGGDNNHYEHNTCDAGGVATDGGFSANVNSSHSIWTDNTVKGLAGVSFGMEAAGAHDVTFAHNHIEGGYGQHGIRVLQNLSVDSYNVTIDTNDIASPTTAGMYCIDAGFENQGHHNNPTIIKGNTCIAGGAGDVRGIYAGGFNKQIIGNYIYAPNSTAGCIFLDASTGALNSSFIDVHGNLLNGCAIGVHGAASANYSNIYEGPELYEGVTTESDAISAALTSFADSYISSEARFGVAGAQWGFGTFGSATDWSLHDVANSKQPIIVRANSPSSALVVGPTGLSTLASALALTGTPTAGTVTCSESFQGTLKVATCFLSAYQETGAAQTATYPVAFSAPPSLLENVGGNSCGTFHPSTTASVLTLPANATMTAETCGFTVIGQ